jgi:hypothetical protein
MFFRFWAFKKWVFPDELGKRRRDGIGENGDDSDAEVTPLRSGN